MIDFAVDVYPHYGSDAEAGLRSGIDCRHGLIGSGVYASHGYERSHVKGMENTFRLLKAYLNQDYQCLNVSCPAQNTEGFVNIL